LRWLVFRLMFLSGVVKLTSGDPAWRAWEAMKYHYETQPLPTSTSWYMHQMPARFHSASVGFMFWAELLAPLLIFGPRPFRLIAAASFLALQVMIATTGNYGFFNLLAAALCVALLDDRDLGARIPLQAEPRRSRSWRAYVFAVFALTDILVTTMEGVDRSHFVIVYPGVLESVSEAVAPLRSANAYGLFEVMTTERPEIAVEGSDDGLTWKPYRFRWKPDELDRRPRFTTPHMPRLDWQMWFAALAGSCRAQPWFVRFEVRLLEGSPEVLGLLRENPFPDKPPSYVRARLETYRFTKRGARHWWEREDAGLFCPPISLRREPGSD
jgi:hypothetical protein